MFIGGCHEALRSAPSRLTDMGFDRKHFGFILSLSGLD